MSEEQLQAWDLRLQRFDKIGSWIKIALGTIWGLMVAACLFGFHYASTVDRITALETAVKKLETSQLRMETKMDRYSENVMAIRAGVDALIYGAKGSPMYLKPNSSHQP